ncbi:hypothetical protein [Mycobacterium sp. MMS18-G62]
MTVVDGGGNVLGPRVSQRRVAACHVRKSHGHVLDSDPAQVELARLNALSPADLAGEIMSAFGPDGPKRGGNVTEAHIADWLFRSYRRASVYAAAVRVPVLEALQVLEHAELIRLDNPWSAPNYWCATRLGLEAIVNGDARQVISDR